MTHYTRLLFALRLLFKNNTKVRVKKFKAMMKRELEYPVDECLKHGFVDEVYKGESVIGKRKRE